MFDETKLYFTDDDELTKLGRPSTLAHWRSEKRGPAYIKIGSRVAYTGKALNEWLDSRTVEPRAA